MRSLKIPKFLIKKYKELFILVCILSLTLFFKLYNFEARIPFGWDQSRDSTTAWEILVELNHTLIGPQVVSDNAFFLGPLWYYFLTPFFFISRLDPIALGYAVLTSTILTSLAFYFFIRKLAGIAAAIIGTIIIAGNSDLLVWNPMLVPLFSIGILYCIEGITLGRKKFLIPAFLLLGMSLQIHIQMLFFFIPLIFALIIFLKSQKLPLKEFTISLVSFALTFLPLIFFDLRNNFINFDGIVKIFSGSESQGMPLNYFEQLSLTLPKTIFTNSFLPELFISKNFVGPILTCTSLIGILTLKTTQQFKVILIMVLIMPVFVFSFYKGKLSEYYFYLSMAPSLIGFSNFLKLIFNFSVVGKLWVVLFLIYILFLNFQNLKNQKSANGLLYYKQAVEYLKNQKQDRVINVSFDMPYRDDAGFKYLFKYYNLNVKDTPEAHLWTITIPANKEPETDAVFSDIAVIRR